MTNKRSDRKAIRQATAAIRQAKFDALTADQKFDRTGNYKYVGYDYNRTPNKVV